MKYTHLGRTGLTVSRICLGTMNFGPQTDEAESDLIMDRAIDEGINFFDTANVYGFGDRKGWTEEIVGRWFAQGGGRREKTVIATKLYGGMSDWPNDTLLSARNIRHACEASLRRLQTDYIDLYQMHHVDRKSPWDEIWQAMETLVQQGKILYAGSSNFAGWHLVKAQEAAKRRHFTGLASEQSLYNLMVRTVELEVLPAALDYGIGILPWSPVQGGLLGGILRKQELGRSKGGRAGGGSRREPRAHREVRGLLRRARPRTCRRRGRVAAPPARGDLADRRAPHDGAPRRRPAGTRDHARRRRPASPRRALPWPWRHCSRGLCVVKLGFYTLAGAPKSPRDLIQEVHDGERLGLGWVFISERFNIKEAATLSGAVGAVSSTHPDRHRGDEPSTLATRWSPRRTRRRCTGSPTAGSRSASAAASPR